MTPQQKKDFEKLAKQKGYRPSAYEKDKWIKDYSSVVITKDSGKIGSYGPYDSSNAKKSTKW